VQVGRTRFGRFCYLIIDLVPLFSKEPGPDGLSRIHLNSAVELGCLDLLSFLLFFFLPLLVFQKEISRQDRLPTTIGNAVDPQHPRFCRSSSVFRFSKIDRCRFICQFDCSLLSSTR